MRFTIELEDNDVATIEALHDSLLECGYSLNSSTLKKSRELTNRMCNAQRYGRLKRQFELYAIRQRGIKHDQVSINESKDLEL